MAAEAQQVERTQRRTCLRAESEFLCPSRSRSPRAAKGEQVEPKTQEEVWAGKAVNYAAKAAQCADRKEMWVTGSVWDRLEGNDYITYSCSCGTGPSPSIWEDVDIDRLPEGEEYGRKLKSTWCVKHGDEFCNAILDGKTKRPDVEAARWMYRKQQTESVVAGKRRKQRELRVARFGPR
jgi:hypothetical protein